MDERLGAAGRRRRPELVDILVEKLGGIVGVVVRILARRIA
jgi:hypothetical protein